MKEKFYNTNYEEQETNINIDYSNSEVCIYTSRKSVYLRLLNKLGNPKEVFYTNKKISGAIWKISFFDKKMVTSALSRPLLIGNIK